jgi:hypothetical protein
VQLRDLLVRGSPSLDRFKHRQDVHRLLRVRTDHQEAFQAFAAFVAHTNTVWPLRAASSRTAASPAEIGLRFYIMLLIELTALGIQRRDSSGYNRCYRLRAWRAFSILSRKYFAAAAVVG